eukprot:gene19068-biopygen5834
MLLLEPGHVLLRTSYTFSFYLRRNLSAQYHQTDGLGVGKFGWRSHPTLLTPSPPPPSDPSASTCANVHQLGANVHQLGANG